MHTQNKYICTCTLHQIYMNSGISPVKLRIIVSFKPYEIKWSKFALHWASHFDPMSRVNPFKLSWSVHTTSPHIHNFTGLNS